HGPVRLPRARGPGDRQGRGVGVATRTGSLRHHHHALRRGVLRLARPQPHRAHRQDGRQGDADRPADRSPGPPPGRARLDGPYGITTTPSGEVYYASLAGNHIARIDTKTGKATPIDPPTEGQGARRVWSDSQGRIWVSEWMSGQVSVYDPAAAEGAAWRQWKLPGSKPKTYSVWVDEHDKVWLTDFDANAIVRFDPDSERFESFPSDRPTAAVRQMLGRDGEAWGAESGTDRLVVMRYPD